MTNFSAADGELTTQFYSCFYYYHNPNYFSRWQSAQLKTHFPDFFTDWDWQDAAILDDEM